MTYMCISCLFVNGYKPSSNSTSVISCVKDLINEYSQALKSCDLYNCCYSDHQESFAAEAA